ncbi:sensor histidine kinase [Paenibacillus sp. sgz500958]|uniref:sensor histidine kinase n=1 Tax=Paenibacillus sp. sgz500958 TaxID=3242475 RepID=UPI0036D2F20E
MILFIPTITLGLWEYIRHQFLLPFITMNLGNWLTPLIIYLVSITLLNKLFRMLENIQAELEAERSTTAALEAREQLARELHDGIAQSLFLLSVKADRLERQAVDHEQHLQDIYQIRKTVHEVNRYVRQAIAELKDESVVHKKILFHESINERLKKMVKDVPFPVDVEWSIPDSALAPKEQIELLACIREAVVNMEKHSYAVQGWIMGAGDKEQWKVTIQDNGRGFVDNPFMHTDRYGLKIMKERAEAMSWTMGLHRDHLITSVELVKEVKSK